MFALNADIKHTRSSTDSGTQN